MTKLLDLLRPGTRGTRAEPNGVLQPQPKNHKLKQGVIEIGTRGTLGTRELSQSARNARLAKLASYGQPLPSLTLDDPAELIVAYLERVAICIKDGGVSEVEAHRTASKQTGADIDTLARRQIDCWRNQIKDIAAPGDLALAKLRDDLLEIIVEPWAKQAAREGWDDVAVFGVHPIAPTVRVECWGLAPSLVLSPHNRLGSDGIQWKTRLVELTTDRAVIETPTGARFTVNRFAHALDEAIPAWQLAAFSAPAEDREAHT